LDSVLVIGLPHRGGRQDEDLQDRVGMHPGEVGKGLRKLRDNQVLEYSDAAATRERTPGLGEGLRGERQNALGVRQEFLAGAGQQDPRR
jgi:hypothetical protein